ncbi:LacI family DNA-binding transcriptional regulator [Catenulispora yoronensis]
MRRRSDMVGLIWDTGYATQNRRHPFLQDLFVGIKQTLAESGHHLMLLSTADFGAGVDVYVRAARQHSLAGVIMMGVDEAHPALTALVDTGIPGVGIDLSLQRNRTTYVTSDNRTGAAAAVRHLFDLGHRAIATITGPLSLMPAAERLAGYEHEMARLGLSPHPDHVVTGDFFLSSGYDCAAQLLALPEPPTAIFAAGDEMAIGALHALADAGLRAPDDVAVVGFDDIEAASLVRPTLTTVAQDRVGLGAGAVQALLSALDDDGAVQAPLQVATRLVVRGSCGGTPTGG